MDGFVHLHVHSHYSLLDGAIRIKDLVKTAKAQGSPAVALTDHGNMFGAVEFYNAAKEEGIRPILGLEAYISPTTRQDRSMGNPTTASYHMILLAASEVGWQNLLKLSSRSFLEGFYYKPRIDRELLGQFSEGLVCTTACLGGEVPSAFLCNQPDRARKIAGEYLDIFGKDRFFIEVQNQGIADQNAANPHLVKLAGELGVRIVGTNDVHFLRRQDKPAHEVLTCISTGKTLAEGGALEYPPEIYLKDMAEMRAALADLPGAADNTLAIAEMCDLKLHFKKHLPVFDIPGGLTAKEHLTRIGFEALNKRFGGSPPEEYRARLAREIDVIDGKGYCGYLLIVHDFVQFAKKNGIPIGARGSGCATLLGYVLDIVCCDPIRYGLLFERWTDPQRTEDPDFDIDICQEGRGKVIQYVREKYGHVAQIITYGTLKPKAVIRDVGRVMDIPLIEVDAIAKKVPDELKMTLDKALEKDADFKSQYDSDPRVHDLIEYGKTLEGLARHAGVHAAGVIVADEPLENIVPLCKQADSEDSITQWDGPTCEKVGLMKMDFLGLRTLTIIQRARDLVRARGTGSGMGSGMGVSPMSSTGVPPVSECSTGILPVSSQFPAVSSSEQQEQQQQRNGQDGHATQDAATLDIDPEALPLDDDATYELFRRGQTDGVFQFESDGMKGVLAQMKPTRIEDLIAANAMYRPGPMELIPAYCARKNGREEVPSVHPLVDDILAETYGIMCYQEQVMQVLNRLGKLTLNRALTLIKAISKKKAKQIAEERPNFIAGAGENGISQDEAERLFELIQKFAGYGFNKAHSTRYAIIAYQTAWFKVHYPREFLAATMTFECSDTDKIVQYMAEAGRMGVKIAPPDINLCDRDFAVDGERVRFGLAAVKGVGTRAVEAISEARREAGKFTDLYHFCKFADLHAVNRATIEALIKCGAFDGLSANRAQMMAALDDAIELGQSAAQDRRSGQMSIFDGLGGSPAENKPKFHKVDPWSESQLLAAEKETLGFYVTSHPLVRYGRELTMLSTPGGANLAHLDQFADGTRVMIGCSVASIRPTVTKNGRSAGKKMAMLTLEDLFGKSDAVVFSETYEKIGLLLAPDAILFVSGSIDRRREKPSIIVDDVIPIDQAIEQLTFAIKLAIPTCGPGSEFLRRLQDVLTRHGGGNCMIVLEMAPTVRNDVKCMIRPDRKWFTKPTRKLMDELLGLLGEENLTLRAKELPPPSRRGQWKGNGNGAPARGQNGVASEAVTRFN